MKAKLFVPASLLLSLLLGITAGFVLPNIGHLFSDLPKDVDWFSLVMTFVLSLSLLLFIRSAFFTDRASFRKDVQAMTRYKYLLWDLVSKDVKTKYRRSVLGVLWSVLNPLLMMLVLTTIFKYVLRVQVEGEYALFYLVGYIVFNFISESTNFSLTSVLFAAALIKKVYVPKYIFPLEKCLYSLVNFLFSTIAFVLVFVIFTILGRVSPHPAMLFFPLPVVYLFIFSLGLSLILSALNVFFRDIGHIYGVFLTVWMYASPVIYPPEALPDALSRIMHFNPLYHYINYFRNILIYGTVPSLADNVICLSFSVLFLLIGILVFRKSQDKFILYI